MANTLLKPISVVAIDLTIQKASPLFHMVGTGLVIPVSILLDFFLNEARFNGWFFSGTALVVFGWGLEIYAESKYKKQNAEEVELVGSKDASNAKLDEKRIMP